MSNVIEDSISMPALSRGTNGGIKNTDNNPSSGEEVRSAGLEFDNKFMSVSPRFSNFVPLPSK